MFVNGKDHLIWITWLAVTVCSCLAGYCPLEECSGPEQSNVKTYNCKDIEAYIKCMKSLSKKCRGDISYHSAVTVLNAEFKKKCSGTDDASKSNGTNDNTQSMIPSIYNRSICPALFDDHHEHKFCVLFGDPHLRTFDGRFQTCRIHGAWQVVDNPFISIMVTNDEISNNTSATAITKLTILIKSHTSDCTTQKIYEAQGDFQLPETFGDGSNSSGPASSTTVSLSWRSNDPNSETVIIRLSYISTIITITRVGKYLSVSARLPDQLAQTSNQEKNELCSSGCPASEQFDIEQTIVNDLEHSLNLCRNSIGPTGHRLTDQYLDWCVFDLMISHNEQFVNASHAAYSDVLFFEPQSLSNRTISVFESGHRSTANISQCGCLKIFVLIFIMINKFLL